MSEICQIDELISKFKLQNNSPLTRFWINFLLIKKNDIQKITKQALDTLNIINQHDNNVNNNLTYENIITLYNINKFNNT
jgi:hypothetical protein|tara:strand:+ start:1275 stop:1514 length:240 start_codon:yes stop_codon:yes gene_type:complete